VALAVIVIAALTLKGSYYGAVVAPVVVIASVVYVVGLIRINRKLATALTQHFGFAVKPSELPQFRSADHFDTWVTNTVAGIPPREKLLIGGLIKLRLPPK
jgi:hypothetical protein